MKSGECDVINELCSDPRAVRQSAKRTISMHEHKSAGIVFSARHKLLKNTIIIIISLLSLIFFQNFLLAQESDNSRLQSNAKNIQFEHLTVQNGLSGNDVAAVLQDNQGFMWFGTTSSGLNKFDGIEFTNYVNHHDAPDSVVNNYTWRLYQDKKGAIWIVTWGGGVSCYDPVQDTFTNFYHEENNTGSLSSNLIWSILVDSNDVLWVGTDGGLDKYDPERNAFIHYRHDPNDPASLSHNKVSMVIEGDDGLLWVSTYGGGLNKFDPKTETFIRYRHNEKAAGSLDNDFIWSLRRDKAGILWIGSERGLDKFDPESEIFTHYRHDENNRRSLSGGLVTAIYQDSKDRLWIGTSGHGLNLFDPETETFLRFENDQNNPHSLADNTVWDIYEDVTGALWFATFNGVDRYDSTNSRFIHYQHYPGNPDSLSDDQVQAIYHDPDGKIWIGTRGGGLNYFDPVSRTFRHFVHDPANPVSLNNNTVLDITRAPDGELWIGTGDGVARFDQKKESFIRYQHDPADPNTLSHGTVWDLDFSPDGSLWIGMYGGGLDRYDPSSRVFTHFMPKQGNANSLMSEWVTSVLVDSTGMIWIGTEGGLTRLDPQTQIFTNYLPDKNNIHSLSDSTIHTIYQDDQGTIWVGTNQGLNRFNQKLETFTIYRTMDGLPGEMVASIINDNQGNLWLGTNQGLSKFDPKRKKFRNYDVRDGLQSNQFRRKAVSRGGDGQLFFGGTNGFNAFYPKSIIDNQFSPPIKLTEFLLSNKPVEPGNKSPLKRHINVAKQITLTHEQSVFSFKFASLNFRYPQKNQYAYMMEGFDKDWTNVDSHQRFATYTNLDQGGYTFRVKGSNNDGIWNDQGASIKVVILPPWWETTWFRVLFIMIMTGLIWAVFQWRLRMVNAHQRELEKNHHLLRSIMDNTFQLQGLLSPDGKVLDANSTALKLIGAEKESVLNQYFWEIEWWSHDPKLQEKIRRGVSSAAAGDFVRFEAEHIDASGKPHSIDFSLSPVCGPDGKIIYLIPEGRDITEFKQIESFKEMSHEILKILNGPGDYRETVEDVLVTLKRQTRFDAVGIRLQDGEDFPYFAQDGFTEDFLLTENSLLGCQSDGDICPETGKPIIECTCGLVISGKADVASSFFTKGGSFWTNDSSRLSGIKPSEDARRNPRNVCIHKGYASIALVPVQTKDKIVGLIQFNDHRKGCFSLGSIEILEGIASHIGAALIRMETEKELQQQTRLQELLMNMSMTYINLAFEKVESSIHLSLQEMAEFVEADRGFIYEYDFDKNIGTMTHEWFADGAVSKIADRQEIPLLEIPGWDVAKHRRGEPIWIPDAFSLPQGRLRDILENGQTKASLSFPLMASGECLGFVGFSWIKQYHDLSVNEQRLLTVFATMMVSLRQKKLAEEEKRQLAGQLQQAQKMESIGQLAGGIAHDFNNLLFPIIGMSEMLLEDLPHDSLEHENVQEIFNAGKRASDLVKQILSFSRQSEHRMTSVRIQKVLKEVLKLSRSTIPSNIEIQEDIDWECGLVIGDATQIHQVAMNLITNAFHATEETNGIIGVTLKQIELERGEIPDCLLRSGQYIKLSVTDNGTGIPANLQNKIFDPYFSTKKMGKGTGLGLAVVYGIIKKHNGDIKVYSEEGQGTTFNIYLPMVKTTVTPDTNNQHLKLPTGTEKILLVDDDKSVARLESKILSRLGYQVTILTDSIEAVNEFKSNPDKFDLVISDMTMPNMTGDQLVGEILSIKPEMPIIICTGFSERVNEEKSLAIGVKGFLMKPVIKYDMAQMVRNVLDEAKN